MASCTSTIYTCPSFNTHSSNNIADIADRVVHELLSENRLHNGDDFTFIEPETEDHEFEFPVVCTDSNSCQIVTKSLSDEKISPRYPLFDRSLLTDGDSKPKPSPAPATRPSLMKLFSEDRDTVTTSVSNSTSESDELDGISPETYCVWTPKADQHPPRGKHKKSNSISIGNTSNRWKVRDLLKRSYSDDNYTVGKDSPVFLFVPPVSPEKVNNNNNKNEKKKVPAYKSKVGNIHLPPFLPYRQDQLNFNGLNKNRENMYRY
ncbi:uncharacterized protein LOC143554181 [Bidens hawaiensis]|uniref:uncharacterized protein LOC143554181 n=1 Tax=Bidens hawaiensis TaxID=980011 RepID=UPI00404A7B3E